MRFMIIVEATKDSEAGTLPDEKLLAEMGKFNEDLAKAGVLLAGEGLQSSAKGARVVLPSMAAKRTVGRRSILRKRRPRSSPPVSWLWKVNLLQEAIDWSKSACPTRSHRIQMPIQPTFWAERFGMLVDRFGIPWMVNCDKPAGGS
jgi:hypothetical protein